MRLFFRIVIFLLCIMFLWFAALQWNDPDPYIWIPIYLVFAVLGLITVYGSALTVVYWLATLLAIVLALLQWPDKWEGLGEYMMNENMERARESVGLLICAASSLIYLVARPYVAKQKSK